MSRWTIFRSWRVLTPRTIQIKICHTYYSLNLVPALLCFSIYYKRSPPSAISMTIHKQPSLSSKNASLYPITFKFYIDASILISFKAFYFSRSVSLPILTFFIAQQLLSDTRFTWNTLLKAPSPSFFCIVNSFIDTIFLLDCIL